MVTMSAIETKDLATRDEDKEAVNGVTLDTVEGRCCGLLRPNGRGKTTTTMSMLSTITKPTRTPE
jgi:ABC-type multidrug transport system ATPase subunit